MKVEMKKYALQLVFLSVFAVTSAAQAARVPPGLMTTSSDTNISTPAPAFWSVHLWERHRRGEIFENFEKWEFGRRCVERPKDLAFKVIGEDASALGGKAVKKVVRISYSGPYASSHFDATCYIPKTRYPAPAYLLISNRGRPEDLKTEYWPVETIVSRGYATVTFFYGDVAADDPKTCFSTGVFKCYMKPGEERPEDGWGALSAWAWGASRVMDWIRTEPLIDSDLVSVIGHSRGGKAALWAGATDKRFAMATSNCSGCGGAKLNSMDLPQSESIAAITKRFPHWFAPNYAKWAGREDLMPFDQHQLIALMAPRLVGVGSAVEDKWAGPEGEFQSCVLASPAWYPYGGTGIDIKRFPQPDMVNLGGTIGYHLRPGKHDLNVVDWNMYMDFTDYHRWRYDETKDSKPVNVPELLVCEDGTKVTTKDVWEKKRRGEIREFYRREVYGRRPVEKPRALKFEQLGEDEEFLGGRAVKRRAYVSFEAPGGKGGFHIEAYIPKSAKPVPGFIYISFYPYGSETSPAALSRLPFDLVLNRGYAIVQFLIDDINKDMPEYPRPLEWWKTGVFKLFDPDGTKHADDSWGALAAWAWGASRTLDWIETQKDLDARHFATIGNSRGGKTALWAACEDERIAMACVNCSCCLGAKLNHIDLPESEQIAKLQKVQKFWFCRNLSKWCNREFEMPYDTHQLCALLAPRLLAITEGDLDAHSGPRGHFYSALLASPAWELYGRKGLSQSEMPKPGYAIQGGDVSFFYHKGGHGLYPCDWARYMDFADAHGWRK